MPVLALPLKFNTATNLLGGGEMAAIDRVIRVMILAGEAYIVLLVLLPVTVPLYLTLLILAIWL
jgi:hypothetical protein